MAQKMKTNSPTRTRSESGFTLIELALVLTIIAVLITPLIQLYTISRTKEKNDRTNQVIADAASYLSSTVAQTGNYPCPASRTFGEGNANFGVDYCSISAANRVALNLLAVGGCLAGTGICKVAGSADRDGDSLPDPILIGAVPFATLATTTGRRLGAEDLMLDSWGNMLTYAVSQNITIISKASLNRVDTSQDYRLGVIAAVDEFGNPTAGISNQNAQFALVSHGPDLNGSYTRFGVLSRACSTTALDRENCNNDNTFMSALGLYETDTANHFDDIAYFYLNPSGDIWKYLTNPATGSTTASIYNLNSGNVGVGTTTPQIKLDVNGNIRTPSFLTNMICRDNGTSTGERCLPTSYLNSFYLPSATSYTMPSGTQTLQNACPGTTDAMSGVSLGKVQCTTVAMTTTAATPATGPVQCDTGAYVRGLLTNGCIICSSGTTLKCP